MGVIGVDNPAEMTGERYGMGADQHSTVRVSIPKLRMGDQFYGHDGVPRLVRRIVHCVTGRGSAHRGGT